MRWVCSTYSAYGKAFCSAKQIPENVLNSIVGERPFRQIHTLDDHELSVMWADGTESVHRWKEPSRSESWTDEMREKARERAEKCQRKQ